MTPRHDEDHDQLNPGDKYARQMHDASSNLRQQENQAAFDSDPNNISDDGAANSRNSIQEREENPAAPTNAINYTGAGKTKSSKTKFDLKNTIKKRGPLGALIAILGLLGISVVPFFGMIMPIDLMERLTKHNDSTSTVLERRALHVFANMTNPDNDVICQNSTKNIKCRMGRISNKALGQLEKRGIVAEGYDGKKSGYPDKNPTRYTFTAADGTKKTVEAKNMRSFLASKENSKFAALALGQRGAFNLRVKSWTGKHINQKLYNKFGLRMNGGIASGDNKNVPKNERAKSAHAQLKERTPGNERMNAVGAAVSQKINDHSAKAQRGGTAYMISAAGCIAVKAPSYIAAGVAAVQLAQVMPAITEVVLSPGSKAKASGVETKNSITAESMDVVGSVLTEQSPRKSDGKMTSALDSKYLLAALGTNTAKMKPSNFSPGYSVLQNKTLANALRVEDAAKPTCNVILSPAAMWTAFAVDATITAAASATVIGGILKIAGSYAVGVIIEKVLSNITEQVAQNVITELATNEDIPNARGEQFGDVLGISAMAFFSSGGMARHLPTLSQAQMTAYEEVKQNNIAYNRQLELASVHPLDPSSQYTITGSIISSIKDNALRIGSYGKPFGMLSSLATLPVTGLASLSTAHATDRSYCSYAADFGLDTNNPRTTPAINASGMPCTGINTTQASMDSSQAVDLLIAEGWVDGAEFDNLPENATVVDLVNQGVIKNDNPLREFIDSCSNPDTGDHVFGAAGCIKPDLSGGENDSGDICENAEDYALCREAIDQESTSATDLGIGNPLALDAMSVFLVDYQVAQSINGEDEYVAGEGGPVNETVVIPVSGDWASPMVMGTYSISSHFGYRDNPLGNGQQLHSGVDLAAPHGTPYYAPSGGIVSSTDPDALGTNFITIDHGNGISTKYGHSERSQILVKEGDTVQAGQLIGYVGNQGQSTGPHLHFMYRINGKPVDPYQVFKTNYGITL